jgi:hypothetical protein
MKKKEWKIVGLCLLLLCMASVIGCSQIRVYTDYDPTVAYYLTTQERHMTTSYYDYGYASGRQSRKDLTRRWGSCWNSFRLHRSDAA